MDTYRLVKLVHLAAVTLWIGGAFSMALLILRVGRTPDRAMLPSLVRHAGFYGRAVVGPSSVLTLLSGMAMLAVLGEYFESGGKPATPSAAARDPENQDRAWRKLSDLVEQAPTAFEPVGDGVVRPPFFRETRGREETRP